MPVNDAPTAAIAGPAIDVPYRSIDPPTNISALTPWKAQRQLVLADIGARGRPLRRVYPLCAIPPEGRRDLRPRQATTALPRGEKGLLSLGQWASLGTDRLSTLYLLNLAISDVHEPTSR
ncbi:hypothetical protein KM043_005051 [Ampulex compressa]|nr:hypothetical protein KM043_005051 [Ampulex compressa]